MNYWTRPVKKKNILIQYMYNYITHPLSKKKINIYSKKGSQILKSYLKQLENIPNNNVYMNNSNIKNMRFSSGSKGALPRNNLNLSFGGSSPSKRPVSSRIKDTIFFQEVDDCRDVIKYCSTSKTTCEEDIYKILSKKHFRNIGPTWQNGKRPSMCNGFSRGSQRALPLINCDNYYNLCYLKNNPNNIMRIPITPNEEIREGIIRAALFPPLKGWGTYTNARIRTFMQNNIDNMCHIKIKIDNWLYYNSLKKLPPTTIEHYKCMGDTEFAKMVAARPNTVLEPYTINGRIQNLNTFNGDISMNIPITLRFVRGGYDNIYFYLQQQPIELPTIGVVDIDSLIYVPHSWEYITDTIRDISPEEITQKSWCVVSGG